MLGGVGEEVRRSINLPFMSSQRDLSASGDLAAGMGVSGSMAIVMRRACSLIH